MQTLEQAARALLDVIDNYRGPLNDYLIAHDDAIERLRAALDAESGRVSVPRQITEAMHVAAVKTLIRCHGNDDWPPRVWTAMLAAAQEGSKNGS